MSKKQVLGCPSCHARPELNNIDGQVRIACGHHPHHPVLAVENSVDEAIISWNANDWLLLGANTEMLNKRPTYSFLRVGMSYK